MENSRLMMTFGDNERTRLMGIPVRKGVNWRELLTKVLFGGIIIGMIVMGILILSSKRDSSSDLSLPETNEDTLITTDIPGAEADETPDDSPGTVSLSDTEFARLISRTINNN